MKLNNLLIEAASEGNLEQVARSLDGGADIHARDDRALRLAAKNGHLEAVRLLLDRGANIHAYDDDALRWAAQNGHLEVVRFLLDRGANINACGDGALMVAAFDRHLEVVRLLLDRGANIHTRDDEVLQGAVYYQHFEVIRLLLDRGARANVLSRKLLSDVKSDIAFLLIQHGLDPNKVPIQTFQQALPDALLFFLSDKTIAKIEAAHPSALGSLFERKAALIDTFTSDIAFDFSVALAHIYYRPGSAGFFAAVGEDFD